MISKGDRAPTFALPDQDGSTVRLPDLLDQGPVVLFWYPAAMTSGCTAESCTFRDLAADFTALRAQRIGISLDPVDRQKHFAATNSFDYPLLSDVDGATARDYGVRRRFGPTPVKRVTFVIDREGIVREVIASELRMSKHAHQALAALRALAV